MTFLAAAHAVSDLVSRIPDEAWEKPGLGDWNVRDLVGHTSRSLVTVIDYFGRPVEPEEIPDTPQYYVAIRPLLAGDSEAIAERGRQAGRDLGGDPRGKFAQLVQEAAATVQRTDPSLVIHTIAGGMRAAAYLPTRTFELVVHGMDIAGAVGLDHGLPADAVEECAVLAARVAVLTGQGPDLILALTGRRTLAPDFSVV